MVAYRVLADATVVLHLAFVLFVIAGAFLAIRWPRVAFAHIPAAAWGAWVELAGWICPLTPMENWLREQAGQAVYTTSFVDRYVMPVLYPPALSREIQWGLGVFVLAINAGAYLLVLHRWKRRQRPPASALANVLK